MWLFSFLLRVAMGAGEWRDRESNTCCIGVSGNSEPSHQTQNLSDARRIDDWSDSHALCDAELVETEPFSKQEFSDPESPGTVRFETFRKMEERRASGDHRRAALQFRALTGVVA